MHHPLRLCRKQFNGHGCGQFVFLGIATDLEVTPFKIDRQDFAPVAGWLASGFAQPSGQLAGSRLELRARYT